MNFHLISFKILNLIFGKFIQVVYKNSNEQLFNKRNGYFMRNRRMAQFIYEHCLPFSLFSLE